VYVAPRAPFAFLLSSCVALGLLMLITLNTQSRDTYEHQIYSLKTHLSRHRICVPRFVMKFTECPKYMLYIGQLSNIDFANNENLSCSSVCV
jgi:hypothetical protein